MLTDGVLDLDGHTLTVNGDFIQTAGEIQINGGTLIITGDYRQRSIDDADGKKEYADAAAKLIMSDKKDKVVVSGSVYIGSNLSDGNNLTAGELRVGKNLVISTANDKCFDCVDDFVLTFYVEKEHYISFTNDSENGIKAKDRMLMVNNLKVEEDTHNSTNEHGIINSNNETANNTNKSQSNDIETDIKVTLMKKMKALTTSINRK
ncbi:MAG: hypothetical protein K6C35_01865 [Eubacterium sp.]|nr:hypothetical protein [Eubacterium sp.]